MPSSCVTLKEEGAEATPRNKKIGRKREYQLNSGPGAQRLEVIIADDNRDGLESLAALLELEGFSLRMAHDGYQALSMFEELEPGAMLLDLSMPLLDGYEVARRLRARANGDRVLLVAITASGQPADRDRASKAGFDYHLMKPIDFDELLVLLRIKAAARP